MKRIIAPLGYHRRKKEKGWKRFIPIFLFIGFYLVSLHFWNMGEAQPQEMVNLVQAVGPSPTATPSPSSSPTPEPLVSPTPTQAEIDKEIREVFGEHYDKAMLLLRGNGQKGACTENRSLNPNALNDNTKWGGVGKDWGVFQINDHWQGIRHEGKAKQFLLDPHINIRIAWRLYQDDGYSFKLWTCGKVYGI